MPSARPDLYPSFREIVPIRPVGTLGLRYVENVRRAGERRFWQHILAYLLGEQPLDHGKGELTKIKRVSAWDPPAWIQTGTWFPPEVDTSRPPKFSPKWTPGRRMICCAQCAVNSGPYQKRAVAYWSLYLASAADQLQRCRRCRELFLAKHSRERTCRPCRSHPRAPGRPRKIPASCAKDWRQFQNRIYQWRSRGVLDQGAVRVLIAAMKTDVEAVRNRKHAADRFSTTWHTRLATWRQAKTLAVRLETVHQSQR